MALNWVLGRTLGMTDSEQFADNGLDIAANLICVCPNCHGLLHAADVGVVARAVGRVTLRIDGEEREVETGDSLTLLLQEEAL